MPTVIAATEVLDVPHQLFSPTSNRNSNSDDTDKNIDYLSEKKQEQLPTSQNSNKINEKNSSQNPLMDPYVCFHLPAYRQIRSLLNDESIISWGIKKQKGLPEELRIKSLLQLPIARLHGLSLEEKEAIWQNRNYFYDHESNNPGSHSTNATLAMIQPHSSFYIWESRICDAIQVFESTGSVKPHVLFSRCNENFGDFSRSVPGKKTAGWDAGVDWATNGCGGSNEPVYRYLNHSNTLAVFTTQHHFLDHPKVHSLPIGIKHTMKYPILRILREPIVNKTQLLMINDNGWKHRKNVTKAVVANFAAFNMSLRNTYSNKKSHKYLEELRRSKFILAPSGLGWDCYRIWEALHLNTIPIIERYYRPHDGWRRTLDDLPVLWVEDFRNLTPSILNEEYKKIASRGSEYNYHKLTKNWWADFVRSWVPEDRTVGAANEYRYTVAAPGV